MTVLPKKLEEWKKQDPARNGVGYGWMRQLIEWIWQEESTEMGSWGPEYFNKRIKEFEAHKLKSIVFKDQPTIT